MLGLVDTAELFFFADAESDGLVQQQSDEQGEDEAEEQYSERTDDYTDNIDRLARKFDTARTAVPQPEIDLRREQIRRSLPDGERPQRKTQ